jgi:hypothetical protein
MLPLAQTRVTWGKVRRYATDNRFFPQQFSLQSNVKMVSKGKQNASLKQHQELSFEKQENYS